MNIIIDLEIYKSIKNIEGLNDTEIYYSCLIMRNLTYNFLMMNKNNIDANLEVVRKSRESFDNLTGDWRTTKRIIEVLTKSGLIEIDKRYSVGNYSKGYKPMLILANKLITLKAEDYLSRQQIMNLKGRLKKMEDSKIQWLKDNLLKDIELAPIKLKNLFLREFGVDINFTDPKESLINSELRREYFKSLTEEELERKVRSFAFYRLKALELLDIENTTVIKGAKGGRFYYVLSNAPNPLRKCMISRHDNKPYLLQLDIKNSQPFFLLVLIKKFKMKIELSVEMAILNGGFYELLAENWGYSPVAVEEDYLIRKEVKEKVFRDIFFCTSNVIRNSSKDYKKIKEKYPLFAEALEKLSNQKDKEGKKRTLVSLLQELETKELTPIVKKNKAISLHDAVIFVAVSESSEAERIKKEITDRFYDKYGMNPAISSVVISERETNPLLIAMNEFML
ncbi:MAG: hypothetical protein ACRCZ9_07340 [Fusobacteriaceae bacterium]